MTWGRSEVVVRHEPSAFPVTVRLKDRRGGLVGSLVVTELQGVDDGDEVEVAMRLPESVVRLEVIPARGEPYRLVSRLVRLQEAMRHLLVISGALGAAALAGHAGGVVGDGPVLALALGVGVAQGALVKLTLDVRLGRTPPWP